MNLIAALGIFMLGAVVQLTMETSAELTAETLADNDIGIAPIPVRIASGDIVDVSPWAMLALRR